LVAYFSAQVYPHVWILEGGEITFVAIITFVILYQFGGFVQMWDWKIQAAAPN